MANVVPDRDARILDAALELARSIGYQWITRDQVAEAAGVGAGSINNAYGNMVGLKRAVLTAAVERGVVEVVAQGMADGHALVQGASEDLKKRAVAHMTGEMA